MPTITRKLPKWMWVVLILLLVAFLAGRGFDSDVIWEDEWYSISDGSMSFSLVDIVNLIAFSNPWHVPGYFIAINLWERPLGWDWQPFELRVFSYMVGVLACAFVYRLGRNGHSHQVGLLAALILGTSAFFVYYMHEIRMYSMMGFLAVLLLCLYWELITAKREPHLLHYILLWIVFVSTIYTHYFMLPFLAAIAVYHLIFAPKNRRWWIIAGVGLTAALTFIPWVIVLQSVVSAASSRDNVTIVNTPTLVNLLLWLFSHRVAPFFLVLAGCSLAGLRRKNNGNPRFTIYLWVVLGTALIAFIVANAAVGLISPDRLRYLISLWSVMALITALGLVQIASWISQPSTRRIVLVGIMTVWLGLALYSNFVPFFMVLLPSVRMTYPLHHVLREIQPFHHAGDAVVHILPETLHAYDLDWYRIFNDYYVAQEKLAVDSAITAPVAPYRDAEVNNIVSTIGSGTSRSYVWLAQPQQPTDDEAALVSAVVKGIEDETAYGMCGVAAERDGIAISQFAPHPVCCTVGNNRQELARYSGASLSGMAMETENLAQVSIWIAAGHESQFATADYSVGMYILDEQNNVVSQLDYGFPAEASACSNHTLDLSALPTGDYHVMAAVYNWQTQQRLDGTTANGTASNLPEIGSLHVSPDDTEFVSTNNP